MKKDGEVREIIEYYAGQKEPKAQENLTAMLREIQETEGWIPSEACQMAAEKLGVKESVLACIIKLYPSLKAAPYVHEILLCTGERCQRKDSMEILVAIKKKLQTDRDGLSRDKRILLTTRNCLKKCRTSPNIYVDGVHYPNMTKEKILKLTDSLKQE